jgi:L-fucose isomerase-like protein
MEDDIMKNIPDVKIGLIAVSRDCFPITLSEKRRAAIAAAYADATALYECPVTVENEKDMQKAVADVKAEGCNALVVFLGNFGPETPETLIAKYFDGPCMFVAAAEGDGDLINGRGDAYCGMLNCSYNLGMRHLPAYIPEYPVGTAQDIAAMIVDFVPIARAVIGVRNLKIITFGPRPQDFFACNAPIKGLYELGVEIEENSELDLLVSYQEHAKDPRIPAVCAEMAAEMGEGRYYPDLGERMAQFELTLLDWAENHKGSRQYVAFADKCWPAFPSQFGFEPCYVNSRLASRSIPVACEVDIYGALSEYIGACISGDAVTLLDINNSVPAAMWEANIKGKYSYALTDTFMGFHCGNTPSCKLCADRAVKYQLIQHRLLEPQGSDPDFTRGTLEGDIAPSDITFYRLQCDSEGQLRSYIAQGEVLPVKTGSFGGIGVFAIPEMGRFYRHVLIQKHYPHHGAVAFGHYGKALFEVFKFLGVKEIAWNQPKSLPYATENPWA